MPDSNSVTDNNQSIEVGDVRVGDEVELARMGYKQELKRDLTWFQNFGVSFSVIGVTGGVSSLFLLGLICGGPAVMVWSWVIVTFFTMLVGLSMAGMSFPEICSAYPTNGGPYFWAAMISKPQHAPFVSWVTGWFSLIGHVAATTAISFTCADFISTAATIGTNYHPNGRKTFGIYVAVLFVQGTINSFGVRVLKHLSNISVLWHILGTISIVIAVLAKAPTHQSGKFVFRTFFDGTGVDGVGWSQRASSAYVAVLGSLVSQYGLTGFDASAYMAEETRKAAMSAPIGMVLSIGVSAILGWFLILGLLFSIQDFKTTLASPTGQPVTQIFLDTVGEGGAIALMVILIVGMFFCGTFSIASNSRLMYAFSRDGAIPGSKFLCKVDRRWRSPNRCVWLLCTLSFIFALPHLGSTVAFNAVTSIAAFGLYISFGLPIALRVIYAGRFSKANEQGPFHLGKFSYPTALVSALWITFQLIVFCLPVLNPVNSKTLNYAPIAVGVVFTYTIGFWAVSARTWFPGPARQVAGAPGVVGCVRVRKPDDERSGSLA